MRRAYYRYLLLVACSCLIPFLAACGQTPSTGTSDTPTSTTVNTVTPTRSGGITPAATTTPVPETNCPAPGTARAAIMSSITLGNHQNVVYIVNEGTYDKPVAGTLKRYDVATGTKTEITKLPNTFISDAQISNDGQWILFVAIQANEPKLQLIRLDGQDLQTLLCEPQPPGGANPASALNAIQWSVNQKFVVYSSFGSNGTKVKLLDITSGHVQAEFITSAGQSFIYPPVTWLDNTKVLLQAPTIDGPSTALYVLDINKGPNQNEGNLIKVYQATPESGGYPCWDADSSFDGTQLYVTQCSSLHTSSTPGPGPDTQQGPGSISTQPSAGGALHVVYTSPTQAFTSVRVISKSLLLLIVNNYGTGVDVSQNGLWKINTDGTGLTHLATQGTTQQLTLNPYTQYANSNVSRDTTLYALHIFDNSSHTDSLLVGSLFSGTPVAFASIADGTQLSIVGWTKMA